MHAHIGDVVCIGEEVHARACTHTTQAPEGETEFPKREREREREKGRERVIEWWWERRS